MKKKIEVYCVRKSNEEVNALGEQGWEIVFKSPIVIGVEFTMPKDAPITKQFLDWFDIRANRNAEDRKLLKKLGYKINRVHSDGPNGRRYVIGNNEDSPLYKWRFEFCYEEDAPIAYITFGNEEMNIPGFTAKEVIDKYVPKEIIEKAIEAKSMYVTEIEVETEEEEKQPEDISKEA